MHSPNQRAWPRHRQSVPQLAALALVAAAGPVAAQLADATAPGAAQSVVVTATRHAMPWIDAPAALSIIRPADIAARGADNVLDAIRGETGLSLQGRAVGGRKVVGIRGMDSKHTLFLVDGRRIGASDGVVGASDFQYDWVAVEDIARIEIVRGPMSVLYGSEAMGGVVNVITRSPGERWSLGAAAEGSSADGGRGGDGWRVSARAEGPLGAGLALRAGMAATRVDAVASPADARISELESRAKRDAWVGLGWRAAAGQRLELEHRAGTEDREAGARERGGARRFHRTYNDIERSFTSLDWSATWGGATASHPVETQLRAYESRIDVANRRSAGVAVNVPQTLTERVLDGHARRQLLHHDVMLGAEARDEALADPGLPGGRSVLRHRSLFVQDEWRAWPRLGLAFGLRHDDHARYGSQWSPRAYAVWRPADTWSVKGGYSHGFKVPNLKQVVPGARAEGPNTFLGNPALVPERSDALELGVAYESGATQAQAMLFDQRIRDLIDVRLVAPGATPGVGTYTYENRSRARLRGAEGGVTVALGGGVGLQASYTYLDAIDGSGRRLERRPRHAATVQVDWRSGIWRSAAYVEFSGDQRLASTTVGAPAQPAPDVALAGAHVTAALPEGLEISLGVRNLTGTSLAAKSPLFTYAEAPRTWRLALRGRW
ncbi:MAG TPA: TonB-dependent receptor [Burkholderiaceae bacterium]|nr:TonB-dependent receptor [Burkholderiaceae bacterium]